MNKKIVVLTGAGISAESGIKTFRDADGLWEGHDVMEVASPEGWAKNPELVLEFYNQRRAQLATVEPNAAHIAIAQFEQEEGFRVDVITQNVDDLHERAGSQNILHLHGQLTQVKSSEDDRLVYDIEYQDIQMGDQCELGSQLRPNIVWFGEAVPNLPYAKLYCEHADVILIIGTSLQVYPAAMLHQFAAPNTPVYLVDPKADEMPGIDSLIKINDNATTGVVKAIEMIKSSL